MIRNIFLPLCICVLLSRQAWADSTVRVFSFKSKNGFFEFKPSDTLFSDKKEYIDSLYDSQTKTYSTYKYTYGDRYYWSLYDTRTNQKLYTIQNDSLFIEYRMALIANNGESVVIVDNRDVLVSPDSEMVHFYKHENLLKVLSLGELLSSMCAISFSMYHLRMGWYTHFSLEANLFKIETNDLYQHTYNLNGELLEKVSNSQIKPDDHVITAKIKRIQKSRYQLLITKSIRGNYHTGDTILIECPDRKMKKLLGQYRSVFPYRIRELKKGFDAQLHLRNKMPILNTPLPSYTAPDFCNNWDN